MKKGGVLLLAILGLSLLLTAPTSALSLKLQPLLYNDILKKGEQKKGFIDISNPTGQTLQLRSSVQAFRQVDNTGTLEFYENEQVSAGVIPDLEDFELGPREVLRMYFLLDGRKLPPGDVFATIFISTRPEQERAGVAESVRLGTLFTIVNGTPGPREAEVELLSASFWQFGDGIKGNYQIKNIADPKITTGFFPEVLVQLKPLTKESTIKSPLVFGGNSRQGSFTLPTERFGIYRLTVGYGDSVQSKWLFVMTGRFQWIVPLLLVFSLAIFLVFNTFYRKRSKKYH